MNQLEKEKLILEWLKGNLEETNLLKSISKEEVEKYKAILETVDNWEPEGSQSNESRLEYIFSSQIKGDTKVVSLNRTSWFVGIAASIALVVAMAVLFIGGQPTVYLAETENVEVLLPDNSTTAILSAGSKLSFEDFNAENRKVAIEGRVYFDVTEKGAFEVMHDGGKVSVLGTQFEVVTFDDLFEVSCYEGKVMVEHKGRSTTLRRKERVAYAGGNLQQSTINQESPGWLAQDSEKFENDLLAKVIRVIETRYNVQVVTGTISVDRRFTGTIPTNNLGEACKKVFSTLGITYDIKQDRVILTE